MKSSNTSADWTAIKFQQAAYISLAYAIETSAYFLPGDRPGKNKPDLSLNPDRKDQASIHPVEYPGQRTRYKYLAYQALITKLENCLKCKFSSERKIFEV